MNDLQNDLILVGATGRLGSSILKTNSISYGICSSENPHQGKKIDTVVLGKALSLIKKHINRIILLVIEKGRTKDETHLVRHSHKDIAKYIASFF